MAVKWNNQLFFISFKTNLTVQIRSAKWFHSQLNVANDDEENMTVDFVTNGDENTF